MEEGQPTTVWHYCSLSAFKAIVESNAIHLNSEHLMNDPLEGQWFGQVFDQVQRELTAGPPIDNRARQEMRYVAREYVERHSLSSPHMTIRFLFCASQEGDDLSQWRSYADSGSGFAIGFSTERLMELVESSNDIDWMPLRFEHVRYSEEEHDKLLRAKIGAYLGQPHNVDTRERIIDEISAIAAIIKGHFYSPEKEWRLIYPHLLDTTAQPGSPLHPAFLRQVFVPSGDMLQPRFKLPLSSKPESSAIAEVVIGPRNPNHELNILALLRASGLLHVKVRKSVIPLR